jgi:hypothetical protein
MHIYIYIYIFIYLFKFNVEFVTKFINLPIVVLALCKARMLFDRLHTEPSGSNYMRNLDACPSGDVLCCVVCRQNPWVGSVTRQRGISKYPKVPGFQN